MSIININFDTESKSFNLLKDGLPIPNSNVESISFFISDNDDAAMSLRLNPQEIDGTTIFTEVIASEKRRYWLLTEENGHVHFLDSIDPMRSTMADNHSHLIENGEVQESDNHIHGLVELEVLEDVIAKDSHIDLYRVFTTSHGNYTHAVYVEHDNKIKIGRYNA